MYRVTVQVVGGGIGDALVFTPNTTELTVTGLTPFTNYSVKVVAVNSIGPSAPSVLMTVMTAEGSECAYTYMYYYACTILCMHAPVLYNVLCGGDWLACRMTQS